MSHCVLADHDCVIDDDSQRHDQSEQAEHVDAAAPQVEDQKGGRERNRDSDRDPQRHAG